jgi:type IV pilus assembly protein PilB
VPLEELLTEAGLVNPSVLSACRQQADGADQSLVQVLVQGGHVEEDALAELVAREVGSAVFDVHLGAVDIDAIRALPEHVARRYLAVPISQDDDTLRVAFANPLDEDALRTVREQAGLLVDPVVATVSGIVAVLDREYRGRTTLILDRRSEFPSEVTREIEGAERIEGDSTKQTGPVRRLEDEATIEQRFEALLLALVDAGVLTRADYLSSLKRLLGRKS